MEFDVLWLSMREIDSLGIGMSEVMLAVEKGFAAVGEGRVELPAKIGIHPREDCFIHAMPCWVGGAIDQAGVKCVSGYPSNAQKGLPYITGVFCLIDPDTGIIKSVMDAGWITAWRTGAASGVYAKYFGNPDSSSVAVIGLGVQGRVNLLAMKEVFPKLDTIQVYDPFPAQVDRFTKDMAPHFPGIDLTPCPDVQSVVKGADVVITCSPIVEKPERFVSRKWLKDDVLAIAVDYDSAFDAETMSGNFVCDNAGQYLWTKEQGTYFQDGYPDRDGLYADMGEICCGNKTPTTSGLRGAVLMGIASHDVMTGQLVYEKAASKGIGTKVKL